MTLAMLAIIAASAAQVGVEPKIMQAICEVESNGNPKAVNYFDRGGPSRGLCQITDSTANLSCSKRYKPYVGSSNARCASIYYGLQLRRYRGNICAATASYNSGTLHLGIDKLPKNWYYVTKVYNAYKKENNTPRQLRARFRKTGFCTPGNNYAWD